MVETELKRDRIVIRLGTRKWEWTLEPRYWRNTLLWALFLVIAPVIAYFVNPGLINTMISANIYAAIAMPLALMTIGTGRMNFGPQFYIGVGGYTAALLSIAYGWGPLTTLPFAILMSMLAALLFSPLVIMARGLYYVLLTLLLPLVFLEVTFIYTDIFKGDTGLFGIVPLLDTGNAKNNFLIIGYFSTAIMFAYLWIINKVKIIAFVAASTMIGIIGWFYAHYFSSFAGITYLPLTFMLKVLLVLMIGGRAQVFGCVVGGYFIAFLEMLMIRFMGPIQPVLFPIILLVLLFILPEGLFGLYRKRRYREYLPTIHVRR